MTASKFANRLEGYIGAEPQGSTRQMNAATIYFEDHTITILGSDPEFNVILEENGQHVFSMNVNIDTFTGFADNPEAIGTLGSLINEKIRPDRS